MANLIKHCHNHNKHDNRCTACIMSNAEFVTNVVPIPELPNDERRYTLSEAAKEIVRQQCRFSGHSWNTMYDGDAETVSIICDDCDMGRRLVDMRTHFIVEKKHCSVVEWHAQHFYDYDGPWAYCDGEDEPDAAKEEEGTSQATG